MPISKQSLLMLIWLFVGLCVRPSRAAQPHALATPPPVVYQNDGLGVQVRDTLGLRVVEDSMLAGDSTWGFSLVKNENGGNGALVLSMSLVYQEPPDVNQAVAKAIAAAPNLPIQQVAITVDGLPAKALFGLPSMSGAVYIYLVVHQQLYRIIYASERLDDLGKKLLNQLHFIQPTRTIASLHLKRAADESMGATGTDTLTATLVITAPQIFPYSWSPDGSTLAYRTFTAEEAKEAFKQPPGTLHLRNVTTGQSCAYPFGAGYFRSFAWLSTGQILSVTDASTTPPNQVVMLNQPCAKQVTNLTALFPAPVSTIISYSPDHAAFVIGGERTQWLYAPQTATVRQVAPSLQNLGQAVAWSPSGKHLTATMLHFKNEKTLATTYAISLDSGQVEGTTSWEAHVYEGSEFLAPLWLNDRQFMLPETVDQGPLLVTVGEKPTPLAAQLFGLPPRPFQRVSAAPLAPTPYYHLVFASLAIDQDQFSYPPLRLYHSATGKVEELPFQQVRTTSGAEPFKQRLDFSPDGKWLLGFDDPSSNVWLWPVDGQVEQRVQLPFHGASSPLVWKQDSTQITMGGYGGVTLFSVPGGEQVGFIKIGEYSAQPFGWSPNGKWLAIRGVSYGHEALFVLPIDPNRQATAQVQQDKPLTVTSSTLITGAMVPTSTTAISTHVLLHLEGEIPASLALDRQAIYWVAWPWFQKIYRYPLVAAAQTPATITVVATSHYPEGFLGHLRLLSTGDWLIFHDSAHAAISSTWQLRALNLTNGTERILAESKDNAIVYGIAAANNRVVWSWLDHHAERPCQAEAVLSLLDLATNQQIELNRACFQTEHHWGTVSMDGDRLVADFWRENTEPGKILGDVVLFDLSAPDPTQFTFLKASPPARRNAFPRLTGHWVSWGRGTQNQGNCVLFNLQTQTQRALPTEWSQTSCQFVDAAAGWFWNLDSVNTPNLLLYQPDQQRSARLRLHTQGHIDATSLIDNTIVVAVRLYPEQTKVIRSVIEWARLDQP